MRPAFLLLLSLVVASGSAWAQSKPAAAPAKPATAPAPAQPAATPTKSVSADALPSTEEADPPGFPTPAQLAELNCANEFDFVADKVTETKWTLRVKVKTPSCQSSSRVVNWKISGDDGLNFVDLGPSEYVQSVKPGAQGTEVEVIPNVRFYAYGAVPVMEGVNAESPVIIFGASDFDSPLAAAATAPAAAPNPAGSAKKP